jgi:hypothetical protein
MMGTKGAVVVTRNYLKAACIALAFSAPAAAQHATDWKPKAIVVGDWVYGCTGGADKSTCEAIALPPEDDLDALYLPMKISRYKTSDGTIEFPGFDYLGTGKLKISVDGKLIRPNLLFKNKYSPTPEYDSAEALKIMRLPILQGKKLTINDENGELMGYVSLKGSQTILAALDKEQKLAGYTSAFIKPGKKKNPPPNYAVMAPSPTIGKASISRDDIAEFAAKVVCDNEQPVGTNHSAFAMQSYGVANQAMLLIDCGKDGINSVSKPFLATRENKDSKWSFEPAAYYDYDTQKDVPMSLLYNVEILKYGQFSSSRYLTDKYCGERHEFGKSYTGGDSKKSPFSLSSSYEMPVCRYVDEWIAVR